jgi:hypothetical protein
MSHELFFESSRRENLDELIVASLGPRRGIEPDREKREALIDQMSALVHERSYPAANTRLRSSKLINDSTRSSIRGAFSKLLLHERQLEWTGHGIWRTFRFWSLVEKQGYLRDIARLTLSLKELTP